MGTVGIRPCNRKAAKMLRFGVVLLSISSALAVCPDRIDDPKVCAILYDEDRCGGWALNIHEGTNIKVERDRSGLLGKIVGTISKVADKVSGPFIDLAKGDDAESVIIRSGCTFTGYDRPAGSIWQTSSPDIHSEVTGTSPIAHFATP